VRGLFVDDLEDVESATGFNQVREDCCPWAGVTAAFSNFRQPFLPLDDPSPSPLPLSLVPGSSEYFLARSLKIEGPSGLVSVCPGLFPDLFDFGVGLFRRQTVHEQDVLDVHRLGT